jgi:hypothetical protein
MSVHGFDRADSLALPFRYIGASADEILEKKVTKNTLSGDGLPREREREGGRRMGRERPAQSSDFRMQERLLDVCEDVDTMTGKYLFEKEQEAAMGTMVRGVVSSHDLFGKHLDMYGARFSRMALIQQDCAIPIYFFIPC